MVKTTFKNRKPPGLFYRVTSYRHFCTQMDKDTLPIIITSHRRAMALYRKEYYPLSRNAIEVLLYASTKSKFTATEIATELLYCNLTQAKATIGILERSKLIWSEGAGVRGRPLCYYLTDGGEQAVRDYLYSFSLFCAI